MVPQSSVSPDELPVHMDPIEFLLSGQARMILYMKKYPHNPKLRAQVKSIIGQMTLEQKKDVAAQVKELRSVVEVVEEVLQETM
jgi:hypothetical protein